jgi:hypothetical protein
MLVAGNAGENFPVHDPGGGREDGPRGLSGPRRVIFKFFLNFWRKTIDRGFSILYVSDR